jgi:hypothetical protein
MASVTSPSYFPAVLHPLQGSFGVRIPRFQQLEWGDVEAWLKGAADGAALAHEPHLKKKKGVCSSHNAQTQREPNLYSSD